MECEFAAPACGQDESVKITDLGLPLLFDGVSIKFENLDEAFESILEGIILFVVETQNSELVTALQSFLTKNIFGILCP